MKVPRLLARALMVWGAISLLATVAVVAVVGYKLGVGTATKVDSASASDVRFVLNWSDLGEGRIEKVVHSYTSGRSFTGDYMDAFAIKISHIELSELTVQRADPSVRWYRGDTLPPVLKDAYRFMGASVNEVRWFPSARELETAEYYVYPQRIVFHGTEPTAVELIIVRPSDKMVFFFGSKT